MVNHPNRNKKFYAVLEDSVHEFSSQRERDEWVRATGKARAASAHFAKFIARLIAERDNVVIAESVEPAAVIVRH